MLEAAGLAGGFRDSAIVSFPFPESMLLEHNYGNSHTWVLVGIYGDHSVSTDEYTVRRLVAASKNVILSCLWLWDFREERTAGAIRSPRYKRQLCLNTWLAQSCPTMMWGRRFIQRIHQEPHILSSVVLSCIRTVGVWRNPLVLSCLCQQKQNTAVHPS